MAYKMGTIWIYKKGGLHFSQVDWGIWRPRRFGKDLLLYSRVWKRTVVMWVSDSRSCAMVMAFTRLMNHN